MEEYRGLIESFVTWCNNNHLKLNISKTKELVVDYRRKRRSPVPVMIKGEEVERVDSCEFLERALKIACPIDLSVN